MAATTKDRETPAVHIERVLEEIPLKVNEVIPAGVIVCSDANGDGVNGSDTAGLIVQGRSAARADYAAGDRYVIVERGVFLFANNGNVSQRRAAFSSRSSTTRRSDLQPTPRTTSALATAKASAVTAFSFRCSAARSPRRKEGPSHGNSSRSPESRQGPPQQHGDASRSASAPHAARCEPRSSSRSTRSKIEAAYTAITRRSAIAFARSERAAIARRLATVVQSD
jgi:hypothetical protein